MDRQSLESRVRALLDKTEENGCTEAEAMAAAEKARQLIDKHQIVLGPRKMKAGGVVHKRTEEYNGRSLGRLKGVGLAVETLTETYYYCQGSRFLRFHFIGVEEDVNLAMHLIPLLIATEAREWARYKSGADYQDQRSMGYAPNTLRASFRDGFAMRLETRANQIIAERKKNQPTGTALVVVKDEMIKTKLAEENIKPSLSSPASIHMSSAAASAGREAADRAPMGQGELRDCA